MIKPLEILKVSQEDLILAGITVLMVIWKNVKDNTRRCINENLKISASRYADHAESRVSKLQEYLKKNRSQQRAYPSNVSQRSQEVADLNKKFGRRMSALFRGHREDQQEPSEEGIAIITIGFQLGLLNQQSASVSDDMCREAVADLNKFRIFRAENLEEGYEVSNIPCYKIY